MKKIKKFKSFIAIILTFFFLMLSLCLTPVSVSAGGYYSPAVSYIDDKTPSVGYFSTIVYFKSSYLPFLYRTGSATYENNGYCCYAWGVMYEGSAVDLASPSSDLDKYEFSLTSGSRLYFKNNNGPEFTNELTNSVIRQYLKFFVTSDEAVRANVKIFDSLASAEAYYGQGDSSGLIKLPSEVGDVDVIEDSSSGSAWSDEVLNIVNGYIGGALESLAQPLKAIVQGILDVINKIETIRAWIFDHLPSFISTPIKAFEQVFKDFGADFVLKLVDIYNTLKDILLKLETFAVNQADNLLPDFLKQAILDGLSNGLSFISGTLENFYNFHVSCLNKVINYLKSLAAIANSDDPFWVKIANIFTKPARDMFEFLFIPDEDYFDNLHTRISNRFSIITDLQEGGEHILNYFKTASGASPPSFTITLSDHGNFKLGNKTVTIDMSWYAPYKSTGDLLIAGAIWARFLWNIYRRLPEILHGAGMIADSVDKLK